jgi:hypothetical protein
MLLVFQVDQFPVDLGKSLEKLPESFVAFAHLQRHWGNAFANIKRYGFALKLGCEVMALHRWRLRNRSDKEAVEPRGNIFLESILTFFKDIESAHVGPLR